MCAVGDRRVRPSGGRALAGPLRRGRGLVLRIAPERVLGGLQLVGRRVGGLQVGHRLLELRLALAVRLGGILQRLGGRGRAVAEDLSDLLLLRIVDQLLLEGGDLLELLAVDQLRHRHAGLLHRQPHHRDHVGDDQDDVLRDLGPGDRLHAAEERAHQDARQAQEDADREVHAGESRRDQAHAVDLRDHVRERHHDRDHDADEARHVAAVARAQEVRNRELAELAHVRREQQRDQHVAPGPPHDDRESVVAGQVQRAGHADERRGGHPVGAGRHAVEHRRHAAARHVVLGRVVGPAHDADAGVEQDRRGEEHVAHRRARQPHLLEDGERGDEQHEAARVERVDLLQLRREGLLGLCGGAHSSSSS